MTGAAAAPAVPGGWPGAEADLDAALARRLRREPGGLLRQRSARVVLDAGDGPGGGRWTVELRRGRPLSWHRGAPRGPLGLPAGQGVDATIRADLPTLVGLVDGTVSGVQAFLDRRVTVRGDTGLALALDGVFVHEEREETWARTRLVEARWGRGVLRTASVGAGPYDAPPVVLLHGLGATSSSLLPLLWDLARDHRVEAPDMPGFGDTDKPRGRYDAAFFVRWLVGFLDALGVERCTLVGNSLGGRVAIEAGLAVPERIESLVLLCPSPAFRRVRQFVPLVRLVPDLLARVPSRVPHALVVEGVRAMTSVPERIPQAWYEAGADEFCLVWRREPAARQAFLAAMRRIYLEEAYGARGFWDRLPSLSVPSLFVWGDRDRLVPATFARHVSAALPDAAAIVLEDCGHIPQMELPEETAEVVRGFLSGLG